MPGKDKTMTNNQSQKEDTEYRVGRDGCGHCKSPYITVIATGKQVCRCDGHGEEDRSAEYWRLLETRQATM